MANLVRWVVLLVLVGWLGDLAESSSQAQEGQNGKEKPDPTTKSAPGEKAEPRKFKRRNESSEETMRKQLRGINVPELGFDKPHAAFLYEKIRKLNAKKEDVPPNIGPLFYAHAAGELQRPDLTYLPWLWLSGDDCQVGPELATRLQVLSINLRSYMRGAVVNSTKDIRPDPDKLRECFIPKGNEKPLEWGKPEALPTLVQMLQTEHTPTRMLLIELLSKIPGKDASVVLAQRAVFDLSPQIREKAVAVLSQRPPKEFQRVFLEALRWPWVPIADHAAEAIAMLQLKEVIPQLVQLLKEPDPKLPVMMPPISPKLQEAKAKKVPMVRELVRINHMRNCTLCHALSTSKGDLVRGRIPLPGEEPPVAYYQEPTGIFVRADTTYLRQDFSVEQPVTNSGKWPGNQRYDYLLRMRPATPKEMEELLAVLGEKEPMGSYPQRDAVLFALKELTGKDLGSATEKWIPLLNPVEKKLDSPGNRLGGTNDNVLPMLNPGEKSKSKEKEKDK